MNFKSKKESETLELKKSVGEWKEIIETISALSNTRGGEIYVGINNSGEVNGVEIGKNTIEDLTNKIKENTDPKIFPHITRKVIDDKSIIIIEVKESFDHLVLAFGRPYKRVGKSTLRMSKDEYESLILEKHKDKLRFDSQICNEASFENIDENKVRWFLKEARKHRGLNLSEDVSVKETLSRLKLLTNEKLTNTAFLLFFKEPVFLQSEVKCIRFSGNEPVKPYIDFQTLEGDVFTLINQA